MYTLSKSRWPIYMRGHSELKGIFVGGCVLNKKWNSCQAAHAHCKYSDAVSKKHQDFVNNSIVYTQWQKDNCVGWIYVENIKCLRKTILLHELAHLIARTGHNEKWRKCLLNIGGDVEYFHRGFSFSPEFARHFHRKIYV